MHTETITETVEPGETIEIHLGLSASEVLALTIWPTRYWQDNYVRPATYNDSFDSVEVEATNPNPVSQEIMITVVSTVEPDPTIYHNV